MSHKTRDSRVAEWAELVGDSVPEGVGADGDDPPSVREPNRTDGPERPD